MAYIKTMKDANGNVVYPQTHVRAVYTADGETLETKLNNLPTKVSELENDAGFIASTVDNLTNYYKKTETYTQDEVKDLINAITTLNIEVVTEKPTENISTTTIYLVGTDTAADNDFEEWIYTNGNWELIGTTAIDLTPYATKEYVEETIDNHFFIVETIKQGSNYILDNITFDEIVEKFNNGGTMVCHVDGTDYIPLLSVTTSKIMFSGIYQGTSVSLDFTTDGVGVLTTTRLAENNTFNNYYTKQEVDTSLQNTIDSIDTNKDWNENDSTSAKYIQNRTHYIEPYGASYFDPTFIIKNISANVMRDAVCGFPREEFILLLTDMNNNTETLNVIPTANNGTITGSGDISISYYCGNLKLLENDTTFTSTSYSDTGEAWCLIFGHMEIPYIWFISSVDMNMMDMRRSGETVVKLDNKYLDIANIKTSELNNDANFINEENVDAKINTIDTSKDWNQNDETAANYIENRTHYVISNEKSSEDFYAKAFSETDWVANNTIYGYQEIINDASKTLIPNCGTYLSIDYDGIEYIVEVKKFPSTWGKIVYVGNLFLLTQAEDYVADEANFFLDQIVDTKEPFLITFGTEVPK